MYGQVGDGIRIPRGGKSGERFILECLPLGSDGALCAALLSKKSDIYNSAKDVPQFCKWGLGQITGGEHISRLERYEDGGFW